MFARVRQLRTLGKADLLRSSLTQVLKSQRNTLYFLGASFGGSVLSFFLLPIFTKYLSPEDFGIIGFALALNAFMAPVFTLSFNSYYIKAYNEEIVKGEPTKRLFSSIVVFSLFWSILLLGLLVLIIPVAFNLLGIRIPFFPSVFFVLSTSVFQLPFVYYLLQLRLKQNAKAYFWVSLGQSVLGLLIPLLVVIYYQSTADARLGGYALSFFLVGTGCFVAIKKDLEIAIDWATIKKAFRFSSPLILYSLAYLSFDFIDRYFIEHFNNDLKILGFYNVGFQFANLIFVFSVAIYRAYEPNYYRLYFSDEFKRLNKLFDYTNYIIWIVGAAVFIALPFVVDLFTSKDYSLSVRMGRWLVLATILQAVNMVYQTYYSIANQTFKLMMVSVVMLLIYCVGGYFLSQRLGYMGTIYSKIIIQLLILIVSYFTFFKRLKESKSFVFSLLFFAILLGVLFVL